MRYPFSLRPLVVFGNPGGRFRRPMASCPSQSRGMGCGSALARAPSGPPRALRVASCVARSRGSNPPFPRRPRRPLRRLALADSDDPGVPSGRFADASSAEEAASAAEDELRDSVRPFLESNPGVVVARVARVTLAGARVILTWVFKSPGRGEILRGHRLPRPRVRQTRPNPRVAREDLIGVEASAALRTLQDRMPPFEADAALDLLREPNSASTRRSARASC